MRLREKIGWVAVIGGALFVFFLFPRSHIDVISNEPRDVARRGAERYYQLVQMRQALTRNWTVPRSLLVLEEPLEPGRGAFASVGSDPWGGRYSIKVGFQVVSPGPDGVAGTDDDIAYPPRN